MTLCVYIFKSSKANSRTIAGLLKSVIGPTRYKPGCLSATSWQSIAEPGTILYLEEWDSSEALKEHFISPAYRKVLAAIELCSEKPEVRFIDCTDVKNLEWLEQVMLGDNVVKIGKSL